VTTAPVVPGARRGLDITRESKVDTLLTMFRPQAHATGHGTAAEYSTLLKNQQ
jgi:hypothetical protein